MPVRRAVPGDVQAIVALARQLFVEDSGRRDPHADTSWPVSAAGREHYARHVRDTDSCVLVAETPAIVGFLVGDRLPNNPLRPDVTVADLQALFVLAGHRSGGIGTALADGFRTWARARGADVLSVTAAAANHGALRFYGSLGFVEHTITLETRSGP